MKRLVAGLALLAVAAAAAVAALPRVAENRILAALGDAGVTDADLTVETIGWRQATVVDLRLGDDLEIASLTVRYEPREAIGGRLRGLIVEGLVLRGAITGDGVAFAALEPFVGDGDGAGAIPLETITLRNSRIELSAPLGAITVTLDGVVRVTGRRDLGGRLDITVLAASVALAGRLNFTASRRQGYDAQLEITETFLGAGPPLAGEIAATLRDGRLAVDGALYTPDGALSLTAGLAIADIDRREARFDLDAELWVTDPPSLNRATLSEGRLALTLTGVIPDSADMTRLALSGSLEMDLDDVSLPGIGEGLSISGAVTAETIDGVVTIASNEGLRLEARRLDLPPPADALTLHIQSLRATVQPGPGGMVIDGAATGRLRLHDDSAVAAELSGLLDFDFDGGLQRFDLRQLTASATDLNLGGIIFNFGGLRLSLAGTPDAFEGDSQVTLSSESFARAGVALSRPTISMKTAVAYGGDGLSLTLGEGSSLDAAGITLKGLAPLPLHMETIGESVIAITKDGRISHELRLKGTLGDGAIAADFTGTLDSDGALRRFDLRQLTASAIDLEYGGAAFNIDSLRLSLAGTPDAFEGNGQITLSSETIARAGVTLSRPRLSIKSALAYGSERLTLALVKGASFDAAGLTVEGLALLAVHVETTGESAIAVAGDGRFSHDLRLALAPMEIETPALAAIIELPALRLTGALGDDYGGTATIAGGALRLPGHDLVLDGIDTTLDFVEDIIVVDFTVDALRHPAIEPLEISGTAVEFGNAFTIDGRLSDGGALTVLVSVYHELASGEGDASFGIARIPFEPKGLQPSHLAPILSGLTSDVSGVIAVEGEIGWDSGGLTSAATLLVEDLSLTVGDVRLERVNTVLTLDSLWPPSTPPGQRVAIGLLDAGLPLSDGIIDFQLRPDGALFVESAVWRWAGGRLKTQNLLLDPNAERHAFTLVVDDLDLAELVALADMDGLSASGRLSGRVPVTLSAEGFAIVGGRLGTAAGGGLLAYAPEQAPAALRLGGEGATLALSVLENFAYDNLRIDIDREAGGDAEIAIHLRGSNADVYDGYPIEFNLNISGPIDKMLRAGLEGYRVPEAVAEKLRGFGEE